MPDGINQTLFMKEEQIDPPSRFQPRQEFHPLDLKVIVRIVHQSEGRPPHLSNKISIINPGLQHVGAMPGRGAGFLSERANSLCRIDQLRTYINHINRVISEETDCV